MRTAGSTIARVGWTIGAFATGAVLTVSLAACGKTVAGQAQPNGPGVTGRPSPGPDSSAPQSPPSSADVNAQAKQTCDSLPKDAATTAFGLSDVTVTTDGGTTLGGGVVQIKCVVGSSNGFKANVVTQLYPSGVLADAGQYAQIMRDKFSPVQDLGKIGSAEVAGSFKQTVDGQLVDEAYAAKKDPDDGTVHVLIVGVADQDGAQQKMIAFLKALAT